MTPDEAQRLADEVRKILPTLKRLCAILAADFAAWEKEVSDDAGPG
jgi:hypothetical protein